jgi:hypothetical protein
MKPEYVEEMKKMGVPFREIELLGVCDKRRNNLSEKQFDFAFKAANEYHALKSAVEELRDAVKETLGAWHGGTMNDVRAAMTLMEEALKETEGLV